MIVLQETSELQNIKVTLKSDNVTSLIIRNELTNVSETIYPDSFVFAGYYTIIQAILPIKENQNYQLTIVDGLNVVCRERIFCTNQTTEDYSINNNEYTEHSSNNDFITYE
jgi:hypothetical protein